MCRPRVLLIDEAFANARDSGKRQRTGHLVAFCSRDFDITYMAYSKSDSDTREAEHVWNALGVNVVAVESPNVRKRGFGQAWTVARVLARSEPASVAAWRTDRVPKAVKQLMETNNFDLIHCEITQMGWAVPFNSGVPTVLDAHNVESVIWERLAGVAGAPHSWVYRDQARKMANYEKRIMSKFDRIVCVSYVDQTRIAARYGEVSEVVPNGVDIGIEATPLLLDPLVILYPGALDWRPAQDGAVQLLREIYPKIRARRPDAVLEIVGKDPPQWLVDMCRKTPGVTCFPNVSSMEPYYNRAGIVAVPLRVGSGSRLKILEAFAFERPVVSTTVGAEGLEVVSGRHLLLADDPSEFADRIVELSHDSVVCSSLVKEARGLVESSYAWPTLGRKLADVWHKAIASRHV